MRFAFGARFAAPHLARALVTSPTKESFISLLHHISVGYPRTALRGVCMHCARTDSCGGEEKAAVHRTALMNQRSPSTLWKMIQSNVQFVVGSFRIIPNSPFLLKRLKSGCSGSASQIIDL
jgi:hypothetical protein